LSGIGSSHAGKSGSSDDLQIEPTVSRAKLRSLEFLVTELQQGLESLSSGQKPDVAKGIDFYEEVSGFEIALIKRALFLAQGHQIKAARLLKLNPTTLNAKIRSYGIRTAYPTKPTPG